MAQHDPEISPRVEQVTRRLLEDLIARVVQTSHSEMRPAPLSGALSPARQPGTQRLFLVGRAGLLSDCLQGILVANGFDVIFHQLDDSIAASSIDADLVVFNLSNYEPQVAVLVRERIDEIHALQPHMPIVALIDQADSAEIHALVSLRTISVVVVGVPSTKIMLAVIQLVILGGSAIRAEVHLRCGAGHAQNNIMTVVPPAVLADDVSTAVLAGFGFTQREAALLVHLREGRQNKVIAHRLDISESTVKVHLRNIMRKLHASNRTQVVNILAAIQQSAPVASDMIVMADGARSAESKPL